MFAYFNDEGFLIVLAESISAKELPSSLQAQLEAKYAACKVNGLYKMDADGDVSYFAEVSNARQKYLLTSVGKKWSVVAIK
jgi:hypothetical protein